jgi:peptidoglycan/xylan/chitin deacetylase (PgdA/CDA1 family)
MRRRLALRVAVCGALLMALNVSVAAASLPGSSESPQPRGNLSGTRPASLYRVPILMYHRVIPSSEAGPSLPNLIVSPAAFTVQLKAFSEAGWHSITLATLANEMEADRRVPSKTFAITFDDGWADGYRYAFPIMRRFGFVGTFFVIGGRIGHPGFLSADQLRTLEAAGNEIGNHTASHVALSSVSESRFMQEVETASGQIAAAVGHRPVSLAYPMGRVNAHVAAGMGDVPGMKIAVTTKWGITESWLSRFETPRVRVLPDTDGPGLLASIGP